MLAGIADQPCWRKKTYNNAISVLRRAFKYGFHDYPDRHNPAFALKGARIRRKERTCIDPFSIHDAETLIAAIHRDWGEAQGNYDEFRFFTGLRPSEQVALRVSDVDSAHGTLTISKACVGGVTRDCTKTGEDRQVHLNPRALQLIHRQLALREALISGGKLQKLRDILMSDSIGRPEIDPILQNYHWTSYNLLTYVRIHRFFEKRQLRNCVNYSLARTDVTSLCCGPKRENYLRCVLDPLTYSI
jgi:integrase